MTDQTQTKPARPFYKYGRPAELIADAILRGQGAQVTIRPARPYGYGLMQVDLIMPTNVPHLGSLSITAMVLSLADVGQVAEHGARQALAHYWAEDPDQPIASAMQAFGLFTTDLADAAAIRDLLEIWHSQTTTKPALAMVAPLAEAQPAQVAAWREGVTI